MKIKMIKPINRGLSWIKAGEVFDARLFPARAEKTYQIVEGYWSGALIPYTHCIELNEEEASDKRLPKRQLIPQEAARALDSFIFYGHDWEYILKRYFHEAPHLSNRTLAIKGLDLETLMRCLLDGYTADVPTVEDKFADRFITLFKQWNKDMPVGDMDNDIRELGFKSALLMCQIMAEEHATETPQ